MTPVVVGDGDRMDEIPHAADQRTFRIVHNIPSPYRLHLFEVIGRVLRGRGYRLHVDFMARGYRDRPHWAVESSAIPFAHTFWHDVGPRVRGKDWHLNPGLIARLVGKPSDVVMVGGPWDSLTGAAATFASARSHRIGWFESNTKTPGRTTGAALQIKRNLLLQYDVLAVPGEEGEKIALQFLGGPRRPIARLPNLVDERRFTPDPSGAGRAAGRADLGVGPDERLAIWVARLTWEKGIVEFLSAIDPPMLAGWRLVIVGDGPLRADAERVLRERGYGERVQIVPARAYAQMPDLYRAADLFVLPSVYDLNPLSVVEAMHSGLPLLVSRRIGNFPEALHDNGWALDPFDAEDVRRATREAFAADLPRLAAMGARSRALAAETWASERAVGRFLDEVLPRPR
jgi:glycosyltransferase involved in cell wall biosynthesis